MKLSYLDVPGTPSAPPAVVLHAEGLMGAAALHERIFWAQRAGAGRVVAPVGNYASYPSGMEIGGTCWYRILPGFAGTDPISLATAAVQVADLLEDPVSTGCAPPLLLGWGQGAVVALGAALLDPQRAAAVACIGAPAAHLELLPRRCWSAGAPPPVLLAAAGPSAEVSVEAQRAVLASHDIGAETEAVAEPGALSEMVAEWLVRAATMAGPADGPGDGSGVSAEAGDGAPAQTIDGR